MSFKMPWASGSQENNTKKTDVSLDDILPTQLLRIELMLLVVLCADSLKDTIEAAFEVQQTSATATSASSTAARSSDDLLQLDEATTDPNAQRKDLSYVRNWTLASAELQSLKAASTAYFTAWRTSVLRRLGKNLKLRPDMVKQAKANYWTSIKAEDMARKHLEDFDLDEHKHAASQRSPPTSPSGDPIMPVLNSSTTTSISTSPPTFRTKLNDQNDKIRALILNATLFILLSLETYPAHSRVLLSMMAASLDLPNDVLVSAETNLAITLQQSTSSMTSSPSSKADPNTKASEGSNSSSTNRWKIGLATVAGAALVGVTGGLAAPFLLGAAGAIMGSVGLGGLASLLGATIANPVTVAALFGVLGGRMGGKAMEEHVRDIEGFEILPILDDSVMIEKATVAVKPDKRQSPEDYRDRGGILWDGEDEARRSTTTTRQPQRTSSTSITDKDSSSAPPTNPPHLRSTLCISGPLYSTHETITPWLVLSPLHSTPLALRYETNALLRLGSSIDTVLRRSAFSLAQAGALQVALPALSAALLPVSLLSLGSWLDNPFSIAMERSDKAGKALANILMEGGLGKRPVTLVGYSTGARVVYSCLMELARRRGVQRSPEDTINKQGNQRNAHNGYDGLGLVENVVLIGAPVASDEIVWRKIRGIVVGRVVNVYTTNDVLLGYLYRVRYAQLGVAGLEAIRGVKGVQSYDVTGLVKGHGQYRLAVGRVLKEIGWDGLVADKVEAEERQLQHEDRQEREIHDTARRNGELATQEDNDGKIVMTDYSTVAAKPNARDRSTGVAIAEAQHHAGSDRGRRESKSVSGTIAIANANTIPSANTDSAIDVDGDGDVNVDAHQHHQQDDPTDRHVVDRNIPATKASQRDSDATHQANDGREPHVQVAGVASAGSEQAYPDTDTEDEGSVRRIEMISLEPEPVAEP